MNNKKPDAAILWKQMEDVVAPTLGLSLVERVVYAHLLRHSLLEGQRRLRFSIGQVARGTGLSDGPVRQAVRLLAAKGALRVVERTLEGHLVDVLPPELICAVRKNEAAQNEAGWRPNSESLEEVDFYNSRTLRHAIHAREGDRCFYCLRPLKARMKCLDHVVPSARWGINSYRNLVSCCVECNAQKGERSAIDFLRYLHRERRLTSRELDSRVHALDALVAGKLRPTVATPGKLVGRKGRPGLGYASPQE